MTAGTVATLLALARDDRSNEEVCDVAAVCGPVADRYAGPLAAEGRQLVVDIRPDLPLARCSGEVLSEVLAVLRSVA